MSHRFAWKSSGCTFKSFAGPILKVTRHVEVRMRVAQDEGYEIVASFGDQWSDLAGTSAAIASFKMPNPFYYIL